MKERAVIEAFAGQLQEVITVNGGVIVQFHHDVTHAGADLHLRSRFFHFIFVICCLSVASGSGQKEEGHEKKRLFH